MLIYPQHTLSNTQCEDMKKNWVLNVKWQNDRGKVRWKNGKIAWKIRDEKRQIRKKMEWERHKNRKGTTEGNLREEGVKKNHGRAHDSEGYLYHLQSLYWHNAGQMSFTVFTFLRWATSDGSEIVDILVLDGVWGEVRSQVLLRGSGYEALQLLHVQGTLRVRPTHVTPETETLHMTDNICTYDYCTLLLCLSNWILDTIYGDLISIEAGELQSLGV